MILQSDIIDYWYINPNKNSPPFNMSALVISWLLCTATVCKQVTNTTSLEDGTCVIDRVSIFMLK